MKKRSGNKGGDKPRYQGSKVRVLPGIIYTSKRRNNRLTAF